MLHQYNLRIRSTGFTIVELLIVIVVIAILAAITIVAYNGIQQRAQGSALQSSLSQAARKMEIYKADNPTYPVDIATAGVTAPADATVVYNRSTSGDAYCLSLVRGENTYAVTNTDSGSKVGGCVPSSGLVAEWLMNGNATDTSGSGMNGTVNGAVLTTGQNGQASGAYSFNGTSDYISLASSAPLNFTTSNFSVSAWINLPTLPVASTWYDILSAGGGDWSVGVTTAGSANAVLRMTKVSQIDALPGPLVTSNSWHHVSAVYTHTPSPTVTYYLDGKQTHSGAWNYSGQGAFTPSTKRIGSRISSGYFRGSIDDLRAYSRSLSSAEITSMYAAGAQ